MERYHENANCCCRVRYGVCCTSFRPALELVGLVGMHRCDRRSGQRQVCARCFVQRSPQRSVGSPLGGIWSPCSGPTLGAVVVLAAQSEPAGRAAMVMAMFSLGAATPILALAYCSR